MCFNHSNNLNNTFLLSVLYRLLINRYKHFGLTVKQTKLRLEKTKYYTVHYIQSCNDKLFCF